MHRPDGDCVWYHKSCLLSSNRQHILKVYDELKIKCTRNLGEANNDSNDEYSIFGKSRILLLYYIETISQNDRTASLGQCSAVNRLKKFYFDMCVGHLNSVENLLAAFLTMSAL